MNLRAVDAARRRTRSSLQEPRSWPILVKAPTTYVAFCTGTELSRRFRVHGRQDGNASAAQVLTVSRGSTPPNLPGPYTHPADAPAPPFIAKCLQESIMSNSLVEFSNELANAVEHAGKSVITVLEGG